MSAHKPTALSLALLPWLLVACGPPASQQVVAPTADVVAAPAPPMPAADSPTPSGFTRDELARHIRILASDDFGGRQPGSEGEARTVGYLTQAFKDIGLVAGNGESWTQSVPYVQITPAGAPTLRIHGADGSLAPAVPADFVVGSRTGLETVSITDAALVFAGYGVTAPEQQWDDYAGWDATDKAVVVLVNDPGFGSGRTDRFKGTEMTYYGRWTYKYEECARRGAAACLIVHEDEAASYGWNVVETSFGARAQFVLDHGDAGGLPSVPVVGWLTTAAARDLFARAGQDFDTLKAAAHAPGFRAVPLGDLKLDATVNSAIERGRSDNVLAALPGNSRPDEWVVVTGHWDHLGTAQRADGGTDIYNGAIDNASGLAVMIEIAGALHAEGGAARSVLFLAVTLEESGLLGSRHYAANPVLPLRQTVANVNIDGLLPIAATGNVFIIGYGQSELDDIVREQAQALGRTVAPNPRLAAGLFYRSDQFAFAQVGVPGLFMGPGDQPLEGDPTTAAQARDALAARYHTPDDTFSDDWAFGALLQDVELHHRVIRALADGHMWPQWGQDSEFRAVGETRRH
ncbi:MAG: M28 family peptidase [Xanthomonadales bacterium]|nr:M28 family peptidase [Xanthomonadales bacterium]